MGTGMDNGTGNGDGDGDGMGCLPFSVYTLTLDGHHEPSPTQEYVKRDQRPGSYTYYVCT